LRIGVFGGTFDPIHWGHLVLAETVRDQAGLSEVLFVPTAVPPHKEAGAALPIRHRLEMTRLAIAGQQGFRLSDIEASSDAVSYSVETLDQLAAQYPNGTALRFIAGADQLEEIETWKDYRRLLAQYGLYVVGRVGSHEERLLERHGRSVVAISMPLIEVSSTDVRRRVADGRSIRFLVPPAVEEYIARHRLYSKPDR